MKFTERRIADLACAAGRKDALFFDDEQRGLAVRVTAAGGRTYLAQYTVGGQKRRVPLGACAAISLEAARKAAAVIQGDVARGHDPAAVRKAEAREAKRKADHEALTLAALIDQWAKLYLVDWSANYAGEAARALRFAFDKKQLERPAADLTKSTVRRVLDELTKDGKVAMAAQRVGQPCARRRRLRGCARDLQGLPDSVARAAVWRSFTASPHLKPHCRRDVRRRRHVAKARR